MLSVYVLLLVAWVCASCRDYNRAGFCLVSPVLFACAHLSGDSILYRACCPYGLECTYELLHVLLVACIARIASVRTYWLNVACLFARITVRNRWLWHIIVPVLPVCDYCWLASCSSRPWRLHSRIFVFRICIRMCIRIYFTFMFIFRVLYLFHF